MAHLFKDNYCYDAVSTDSPLYAASEREDIGGEFGDELWGEI